MELYGSNSKLGTDMHEAPAAFNRQCAEPTTQNRKRRKKDWHTFTEKPTTW